MKKQKPRKIKTNQEVRKMKNVIYKICEKLRGYSSEDEYFEVLQVQRNDDNEYVVVVKVIEKKTKKEAADESNK